MLYGAVQVSGALQVAAVGGAAVYAAIGVRLRDVDVAGHKRPKVNGRAHSAAAQAHAGVRGAVIRAAPANHLVARWLAVVLVILLRHLEGGLNRLGSAADEVGARLFVRREAGDFRRDLRGDRAYRAARRVANVLHLRVHRVRHLFAAVSDVLQPHPSHRVKPLRPLDVFNPHAAAALD